MTFELDTSGQISFTEQRDYGTISRCVLWSDLSPFMQGYVRGALMNAVAHRDGVKFSDISPELLGMMLKDCDANLRGRLKRRAEDTLRRDHGRSFWEDRQANRWPQMFPPLTLYINDQGQVCAR